MPREEKDAESILGLVGKIAYGIFNTSVSNRAFLLKLFQPEIEQTRSQLLSICPGRGRQGAYPYRRERATKLDPASALKRQHQMRGNCSCYPD